MSDLSVLDALAPNWPQMEALLDEALDLAPPERARWLAALPAARTGPDLRAALKRLLDAEARGCGAAPLPPLPIHVRPAANDPAVAAAGHAVGPYRLLRELGHGGMGAVWLAVREDRAPRREVALKLPRMAWGRDLSARMARERDILASLEHPNVARLYDAGVDAAGRPWLALEYVAGAPIDRHCAERALGLRARVELILQACAAVAYAHRRLVVHRDLKPSNILVSDDDGTVRLVDFGIARLLAAEDGATATLETAQALTPDYASPEQLQGQPLSTATDIYSLGVVAYELLCGRRPFAHLPAQGLARAQAVTTREPPAPSSVTLEPAPAAERGGLAPRELRRALAGDLDAILQHALAPAPEDRYASAQAFADDLARWRDGHPVQARAPRAGYVLRKFVARHRGAVAAGSAAVLLLVASSGIAITSALQAREQSQRAQASRDFMIGLFERANPDLHGGRDATARELLAPAQEAAAKLPPAERREVLQTIATLWSLMGDHRHAAQTQSRVSGEAGAHGEAAAASRVEQARIAVMLRLWDDAQRFLDEAEQALVSTRWPVRLHGIALEQRGWVAYWRDQAASAATYFERAADAARRAGEEELEVRALYGLVLVRQELRQHAQTRAVQDQLAARLQTSTALPRRARVDILQALSLSMFHDGRYLEGWPHAQQLAREGDRMSERPVAQWQWRLEWLRYCVRLAQIDEAARWLQAHPIARAEAAQALPSDLVINWLLLAARVHAAMSDRAAAHATLAAAREQQQMEPARGDGSIDSRIALSATYVALALDDAPQALLELAALPAANGTGEAALVGQWLRAVATARHDRDAARALLQEALSGLVALREPSHPQIALVRLNLALLEARASSPDSRLMHDALARALPALRAGLGDAHPHTRLATRLQSALPTAAGEWTADDLSRLRREVAAIPSQLVW